MRTGKSSSSQWSRIEYEGKNAYLISKYVTTDLGDTSQVDAEKNIQLSEDGLYEIVNDNITAKDVAILRKSATVESENVGTLKNGTTLKRIGLGSNGWSKVLYNDQYVYVSTNLITTDMSYTSTEVEDVIYQDVNEQVTTKDTTNLRTSPKDGDIVMTLENGEYIKRIGIGTNNWSKLESSDGTILYGQTNLLTTD
ncbi:MAG: SH3 domain-containing protein [Clostridiales bacterium]